MSNNSISINVNGYSSFYDTQFAIKDWGKKELVVEERSKIEKYPNTYSTRLRTVVTDWHQADQLKIKSMESLHSMVDWINRCVEKHNDKFLNRLFFRTLTPIDTHKPLNISLSDSDLKTFDAVIKLIETNANVRKLDFSEMTITPEIAERLAQAIKQNTTLQSLKLSQKRDTINLRSLEIICEALQQHPTLSTLSLSKCKLENGKIQPVCDLLKNNKNIKNLKLDQTDISDKDAKLIFEAARVHGSLEKLNLYWNYLGLTGAGYVADILSTNPRLKRLEVGGNCREFSNGLAKLAEAIAKHSSLEHLSFYWNYFNSEDIRLIANAIKQNQSISYVDLAAGLIEKDSTSYQILRDSIANSPTQRKIHYAEWPEAFGLGALIVGGPLTMIAHHWENTTKHEPSPGTLGAH